MKQIPLTLVIAAFALIFAEWPSVQVWAEASTLHHYLNHLMYLVSGGLTGWQTSQWTHTQSQTTAREAGVSS